ncbi:MAG: DUF2807 domain-containing protein [Spirochaetes bacterium]|nr:DUF2807 domain-containing protein [Spirochaetota bacterium]
MKREVRLVFYILLFVLLVSCGTVYADEETLLTGIVKESGFYGGPVFRMGALNSSLAAFVGYRGGFVINRTVSIGGGGYALISDVYLSGTGLKMGYGGLELEYKLNPDDLFHLVFRSLVGFGGVELPGVGSESFFAFEPGVGIELNVAKFFKIDAGVSYRLAAGADRVPGITNGTLSGLNGEISLLFGFSGIMGSGNKIQERRDLSFFHSIVFKGNGRVILGQGGENSVTVKADDNVMDMLKTEVKDGTLTIWSEKWIMDESSAEYDIVVTDLREISVSGMGEVTGKETIRADELLIRLGGTGSVDLEVDAGLVRTRISGTGEVRLGGKTKEHDIDIRGAGELDANDLVSHNARVGISGAGECTVTVLENLTVDISGTGVVRYSGEPVVTVEYLSVAGSLEKR